MLQQDAWQVVLSFLHVEELETCELVCKLFYSSAKNANWIALFANQYFKIEKLYSQYLRIYKQEYPQIGIQEENKFFEKQTLLNSRTDKFCVPYPRNAKRACQFLFSKHEKFSRKLKNCVPVPNYYKEMPHLLSEHVMLMAYGNGKQVLVFDWSTNEIIASYACSETVQSVKLVHRPDLQAKLQKQQTIYSIVVGLYNEIVHLVLIDSGSKCQIKMQSKQDIPETTYLLDVRASLLDKVLHVVAVLDSCQMFFYADMQFQFQFYSLYCSVSQEQTIQQQERSENAAARFFPFYDTETKQLTYFLEHTTGDYWRTAFVTKDKCVNREFYNTACCITSPHGIIGYYGAYRSADQFEFKYTTSNKNYYHAFMNDDFATCSDNHAYILYSVNQTGTYLSIDDKNCVSQIDLPMHSVVPGEWFVLINNVLFF